MVEENRDESLSELSEEQLRRFRDYLDQGEIHPSLRELKKSLKEVLDLSMSVLAKRELDSLNVTPRLEKSLDYFANLPYSAESIKTNHENIEYTYNIEGMELRCRDSRWSSLTSFHFEVECGDSEERHQVLRITDGWLKGYRGEEESQQSDSEAQSAHARIYEDELDLKPIRELFLHLPHYDIRPDPEDPGHKELTSGSDLRGKHIWVTPEKFPGSNSVSEDKLVECETQQLIISTESWEPQLVAVRGPSKHQDHRRTVAIEQDPSLNP